MENNTGLKQKQITHQKEEHRKYLWTYYSLIAIGLWLITGFYPMGYESKAMIINDIICGSVLTIFGFLALKPTRYWAMWVPVIVGGWLTVAPLILHAETAVAYTTDTLMGVLIMTLTLVVPNIPGISAISKDGPEIPPGWSYNPSAWPERIPVVFLGWLGFYVARYLAGFQMEFSDSIWDPFFGDGTRDILNSDVSESFPISDAGLGAFAYILDVITGLAGRTARWRTMPWIVLIFGFLVIPLGIVSLTLVILQPLSVGAWCTACLISALITVLMIPFTFDEVLASVQFINKKKKEGQSRWHTFWFGGTMEEGIKKDYDKKGNVQLNDILRSMWDDLKIKPWNLFLSIALGLWFMISPGVFGYEGGLADSNHFVGALIVAISIVTMSEVVRTGRFLNMAGALWLIAAPFLFNNPGGTVLWTQLLAGVVLIVFTFRRGMVKDEHGGFNKYIK